MTYSSKVCSVQQYMFSIRLPGPGCKARAAIAQHISQCAKNTPEARRSAQHMTEFAQSIAILSVFLYNYCIIGIREAARMLGVERLDGIMEMLKDGQAVSIHTLSKALYISESTLRRDLAALQKEGADPPHPRRRDPGHQQPRRAAPDPRKRSPGYQKHHRRARGGAGASGRCDPAGSLHHLQLYGALPAAAHRPAGHHIGPENRAGAERAAHPHHGDGPAR